MDESIRQKNRQAQPKEKRSALYDQDFCKAVEPKEGYECTLPAGHSGCHVAHGSLKQICKEWG